MVAILEKGEHNIRLSSYGVFREASPLRRNLKLQDEDGINSLPDTELFENLSLMGYNISQNQKFTFQKAQEVEINKLKERVKLLEDGKGMAAKGSRDDAPIKGRRLDEEEVATERVSSDTEEIKLDEGYTIHKEKGKRKDGGDSYTQVEEEIWEQIKGGVAKISEGEAAWPKRKGIRSEQESAKKQKTIEEVPQVCKVIKVILSRKRILFWKLDCRWSIKFRGGLLGIICTRHSHCQLQSSHCQKNFPLPEKKDATARRKEKPLPGRLHRYQCKEEIVSQR
nr:hypothetical protein [Tanacetum cinerariifolium]